MLVQELTHGTNAITATSGLTPDEIVIGEPYTLNGNKHHVIRAKYKNHFSVVNTGSGKSFGVAYKGNEKLAKPDYFKNNSNYV